LETYNPRHKEFNTMNNRYLVAVYEEDLQYGGPEEGGWYYHAGSLVRIVRANLSEERAQDYCYRLNKKLHSKHFGPNAGRPSISSVASEGRCVALTFKNFPPQGYPAVRPHYE
jgi:hypothetical protein